MLIVSRANGGRAEVDDELGEKLIAGGGWKAADKPAPKRGPKPKTESAPELELEVKE